MYEILVVAIKWNGQFTYCWLSNMSYMYYFGSPRANIGLDESKLPWHTVPLNLLIVSISIEAVGSENMSKCTVCSIAKWVKYITERHASSSGILMCLFFCYDKCNTDNDRFLNIQTHCFIGCVMKINTIQLTLK